MATKVYVYNEKTECINPDVIWEFRDNDDDAYLSQILVAEYEKHYWLWGIRFQTRNTKKYYLPCSLGNICVSRDDAIRDAVKFYDLFNRKYALYILPEQRLAFNRFYETFNQLKLDLF